KLLSKTATLPLWKSVANRSFAPLTVPIVRVLNTAPVAERSATITPAFLLTLGLKPTIVPSSVEKITVAGALLPPWLITKSVVVLKTLPLGAEGGATPGGVGIVTGAAAVFPSAR